MQCPVCDGRLRPVEKYGVEVDICPECKGIWLDRGELDKILRMAADESEGSGRGPAEPDRRREYEHEGRPRGREEDEYGKGRGKRRSSLLSDILGSLGGGED